MLVAKITFVVVDIILKEDVITSLVAKIIFWLADISFRVTKITFVEAEIFFKEAVITTSVAKIIYVVGEIT